MSSRLRVTYQATPAWHTGSGRVEPLDLFGPRDLRATRRPVAGRPAIRGWLALLTIAIGMVVFGTTTAGRSGVARPDAAEPEPTPARAGTVLDQRMFIPSADVFEPPWSGTINRYSTPRATGRDDHRFHTFLLEPDGGSPEESARAAGATLVVEATRRADVHGHGAARTAGGAAVRVLRSAPPRGPLVLEWDVEGFGLALVTTGTDVGGALRLTSAVGFVHSRGGPSAPWLDGAVLQRAGLRQADRRSGRTAAPGGLVVGQAGTDPIESRVQRSGDGPPMSFVLTGNRSPAVRAGELLAALGSPVGIEAPWRRGGPLVGLSLETDTPVGFRVTGTTRIVFDHPSGVTFWLVSDDMSLDELVDAGGSVDFDVVAWRMIHT